MKARLLVVVAVALLFFGDTTTAKRQPRKSEGQLTELQKRYLEKIQVLAREGGLPEAEWKGITKFDKDVCYEIDCLESALEVMTATNFTVNPCNYDTWLNFACTRRVNGPDTRNQPERLMELVNLQTIELLEDKSGRLDNDFLFKEAQTFYRQCKTRGRRDDKDVKTILKYLSKNYGSWPILTNRDPGEEFEWSSMVAELNRIQRPGFRPLLFEVSVSTLINLDLGQTNFPYSSSDYNAMLTRVATKSGSKKPYRSEQLQGVGNFFNSLSYAAMTQSWAEEMTLEQLEEKTVKYFSERMNSEPNIYWEGFFEQIFQGTDIEISPTTVVSLPFDKVMQVLQSVKYADTKAVANALNFQLATQLLLESTGVLDDLNTFKCTESNLPKEVLCLEKTKEYFGYSLGTTYLNVYYNDALTTPAITSLMDKIKQGYQDVIDDTKWMENKTKAYLKDKIQDMTTFITKPDWLKEPGGLENFYQGLQVASNMRSSYPMNFLRLNNWYVAKTRSYTNRIAKIQESGDLSDFHIYDLSMSRYLGTVQAQFHPMINEARIEGGIVQKPLFGANRPGFMNFGGLGMVLAHEVGHSFDTKGRNYDKNGKSGEFWDPVSVKNYNDWVQTLASDAGSVAYQTSETSAETIDPYKTLNEDIADVLAVYISYFSYQEYLKELEANGKHEKVLPGLKTFEPQKLFFMKYANMWCDKKDTQSMYADMQSIHSAGNTRATLPLKRSKQFAEAFGCKIPKQY